MEETAATVRGMTDQFAAMPQVPVAFVDRVHRLEAQQREQAARVEALVAEVEALATGERADLMTRWRDISGRAVVGDDDARLQVRELMRQTFADVRLYVRGFGAVGGALVDRLARRVCDYSAAGDQPPVDMALIGRSGRVRLISINRRTGAWRAGAEIAVEQLAKLSARPVAEEGD